MHHPDIEVYTGQQDAMGFGKVVPVYREIGGMYQKTLRKVMYNLVMSDVQHRKGLLPMPLYEKYNLMPPWKALFHLHQPTNLLTQEDTDGLSRQLAFEELFYYALAHLVRKQNNHTPGIAFNQETPRVKQLVHQLPFELTQSQKKCFEEIERDMQKPVAMNRLIQGDVGSGKTVVALMAALKAIDHGHQAALMAPTALLAMQHAASIEAMTQNMDLQVQTLVGKHTAKEKQEIIKRLQAGKIDLLIGTHALIEDYVQFQNLGLVIIDEQHRFGVRQKNRIRNQTQTPDVLVMSATPIPRSLALTLFGDIDVSMINEMPRHRKRVETFVMQEAKRAQVYQMIRETVAKGQQVFMVYPLVEASEHLDAKDAVSMAQDYQKKVFQDLRVGLLHGQMGAQEKDDVMQAFSQGQLDILVSTTVIEVGIDVPNATLMVIEHPERFGLAQLHQLRGRVGRGDQASQCILLTPPNASMTAKARLKKFSTIYDGFTLAEEDLKLRGPGDFFGVAQSGMPHFSMAQFPRDMDLLEQTRREAQLLINEDPTLEKAENQVLTWVLTNLWSKRLQYIDVA
jgi:ATP-dependent DNA helicase RecG